MPRSEAAAATRRGISVWRDDAVASFVVFLVALPLCMGIAIASGVPPVLGLITGIVGGLVVGLIQGAELQVSGPAAGLAVVVAGLVQEHGLATLGVIVGLAGAMQLVGGLFGGGRWFRAVPPSVIHGMLAGIGILILGSQFHVMMDDAPRGGGLQNLIAIPEAIWKAVTPSATLPHQEAAGVGIITILTIVLWMRFGPARLRKWLPAPLLGVAAATVTANVFAFPIAYVTVPENLLGSLNIPNALHMAQLPTLLGPALILALIASAETLLCATATDSMHGGPRTDYNKELRAQGVGNMVCGVLGALPMTGVIVRSSANVAAGGRTRWSAVLHGAWLLVFVVAFSGALKLIPLAALAGLLVYVGAKLASPAVIGKLRRYGTGELVLFGITVVGVVGIDLLSGVLIGLSLSAARLLLRLSRLEMFMEQDLANKRTVLHLRGAATFLRLADVSDQLESVPADHELHVHFDELDMLDHAVLELFRTWADQHHGRGGSVVLDWEVFEERYHMQRDKGQLGRQSEEPEEARNQDGGNHGSAESQRAHPDARYVERDRRSTG